MGKKVRNLIGILLLVTAMAVTQIPVSDVEAEETSSASDFQMDGTTLVKYNGTAEDVSISNYIDKIESGAFAGNDNIRRVTIGDSVESIGSSAFSECTNLESVTIPNSVITIDNAAFSGCPSLNSVTVGTGLQSLGNGAFAGDYSLANVRFDSSNPYFTCDDGAIYNKNGWDTLYQVLAGRKGDSYTMPGSVEKIKPYAFWGDYNLQKVGISSNVKEISAYAFSNCKNLKEVDIPYSVKNIDMKAFEDCVRLRQITIPLSVSTIHSTAFDGCTRLEIQAEAGSRAETFAQSLELEDIDVSEYEEAPIPSSVSGNDVADGGDSEGGQLLPPVDYYHEVSHINAMAEEEEPAVRGKTRVIGREAFVLVDNAHATVNVGRTGETLGGIPESDIEQNTDTVPGLEGSDDAKGGSFPKYTVVDNSIIAAQAYYDDEMTSFDIPDGIVRLGEFSFARSALESIRIPDGVETIGYAAFYHCDGLTNVVIPNSVQNIEAAAFEKTPWLTNWKQNGTGDFLTVGDGILLAYKGNGGIVSVPAGVKQIGAEAFKDCTGINKVILPDSVEVIGEAAFQGCSGLTDVEGGNQVKEIRDRAFAECPITTIHIPASAQKIGLRAYDREGASDRKDGVVVFGGESLPQLSYETASTKVYRDNYRDLAFKGNTIAVIPESVSDLTDTVLDNGAAGFEGIVCKMTKEAADGENGTLQIVGKQGYGSFPVAGETCQIDGMTYVLEEGAEKINSSEVSEDAPYQGIDVQVNSYSLPKDGVSSAVMEGSEENYILKIEDSEEAKARIGDVYKKIYGNKLPRNLCAYEISMTEAETGVPITALGKQSVEVTIPIPNGVGEDNLHVVCLDADGQLEEVESHIISVDGMDAITFSAKHFSPYGIYNFGNNSMAVADVQDGQAVFVSLGNKDDSPNTGDNSIHPKWFLCAGLVCTAFAVFAYRGDRRKRRHN
ncbi:MAG: leucine-rich repeat domain-containing protein [Eubacterium sp.]|nr:leucine-rich repeat domain-containing protein [Eubacterium sp.]